MPPGLYGTSLEPGGIARQLPTRSGRPLVRPQLREAPRSRPQLHPPPVPAPAIRRARHPRRHHHHDQHHHHHRHHDHHRQRPHRHHHHHHDHGLQPATSLRRPRPLGSSCLSSLNSIGALDTDVDLEEEERTEQELGMGNMIARQFFHTHRSIEILRREL